jgi:hypothetical protein
MVSFPDMNLAALADYDNGPMLPPSGTSLDFLQAVYRSHDQPLSVRMRAAALCLPYEHPKLAVTALLDGTDDLGARLHRAIQRSAKVIALRAIEAPIVDVAPSNGASEAAERSSASMRRPMAVIRRR